MVLIAGALPVSGSLGVGDGGGFSACSIRCERVVVSGRDCSSSSNFSDSMYGLK